MINYRDGSQSQVGDLIRWFCYDSDDFTTWDFTGIVKHEGVMYLGSGIDFGEAFGEMIPFETVAEEAAANDPCEEGVIKIGKVMDVVRLISKMKE